MTVIETRRGRSGLASVGWLVTGFISLPTYVVASVAVCEAIEATDSHVAPLAVLFGLFTALVAGSRSVGYLLAYLSGVVVAVGAAFLWLLWLFSHSNAFTF